MELWTKILLEVGGPAGVIIFMLIFGKDIIKQLIEKSFQSASEKVSMCYSDNLARHSKAYELLLNKEFDFYEQTSHYSSELIVDIQDICMCLRHQNRNSRRDNFNMVQETYERMIRNIPEYKSNILIAQSFIPTDLFDCASSLMESVQARADEILTILDNGYDPQASKESNNSVQEIQDDVLINCAHLMSMIKSRVEFLSKQQEK